MNKKQPMPPHRVLSKLSEEDLKKATNEMMAYGSTMVHLTKDGEVRHIESDKWREDKE